MKIKHINDINEAGDALEVLEQDDNAKLDKLNKRWYLLTSENDD